ncbi:MAG: hypothetical protein VW879_03100 [Opitutae bacterium]
MPSRYFDNSRLAEGVRIAAGQVNNVSHINKFGFNPALSGSYETIHDAGGIYSYIGTPGTATIAGASDSGAVIEVQGLDADYNQVTEDITVGATGSVTFSRIFRARVKSLSSGTTNQGNITVTVDSAVRATILTGNGQTLMALYTIPADKKGYLKYFQGSVEKNQDVIFKIFTRNIDDGVFNLKGQFGTFGTPVTYDYQVPLEFGPKTDIEIQAKAGATTAGGAVFDLILVDER